MKELVKKLVDEGVLKTKRIIEAFLANDRVRFVPEQLIGEAYLDVPLPIGEGQTISQPYTVALMMELLDPKVGQKILDIGFGSGWTTAILAHVVGPRGRVYGLEIVPELAAFGKSNLEKTDYQNLELHHQSGWEGWPEAAPFDRILVGACAPEMPKALLEQLRVGGKMVIPVGQSFSCALRVVEKTSEQNFREKDYPGFAFVPFVKYI